MADANSPESACTRCVPVVIWSSGHGIINKTRVLLDQIGLIRKELGKPSPDFGKISKKLDYIEQVVEVILNLPSPFQLEHVSINSVIRKRVWEFQQMEGYEAVTFQVDFDPNEPVVRANPVWLRRILDILTDNGMAAMVESTERQIRIGTAVSERGVDIAVSDRGNGINAELLTHLFEKPSIIQPGGRGRGMYIAKIVLDMYGGGIQVDNTGPTGTTIVVWLPLVNKFGMNGWS